MPTWQILVLGTAGSVLVLLLPVYERMLAAAGAVFVVALVLLGFLLRPRKDIFYVQTTMIHTGLDSDAFVEHDRIAIRVELTRLWLLFVPTMAAVAFLIATYAKGTTWKISLLEVFESNGYILVILPRLFVLAVIGMLSAWVGERCVLRYAEACSAGSVSVNGGRVSYHFVTCSGEYHGGDGVAFGMFGPAELATLVVYHVRKPHLNRIGMGLFFHRFVVLGRGIRDLEQAKWVAAATPAQSRP